MLFSIQSIGTFKFSHCHAFDFAWQKISFLCVNVLRKLVFKGIILNLSEIHS